MLKDVTFGQFIFADSYYQSYLNGNTADLNRFIACLYTTKKGFSEKTIDHNALIIKSCDVRKREAIGINYALIREWLAAEYPYVFQHSTTSTKNTGWVAVFDYLVGDDIANHQQYANSPLSLVLRKLNHKTKESYRHGSNI